MVGYSAASKTRPNRQLGGISEMLICLNETYYSSDDIFLVVDVVLLICFVRRVILTEVYTCTIYTQNNRIDIQTSVYRNVRQLRCVSYSFRKRFRHE